MLTIRKEQMAVFAAQLRERFVPTISSYLRKTIPVRLETMNDADLEKEINAAFERAAFYGLETEWDLGRFCRYEFEYGPRFDERFGWVAGPLARTDLTPTERMDKVEVAIRCYLQTPPE